MKIILLSGGSGKRLWPLSNNQRSKQFIKILKDENGCLESMVQRVWRQLGAIGLQDDVYIATGENQRSILKSQLGIADEKIISEPTRRD
ncbi:MAG: mannose-1-phosphate guanylyltransferase, partial [Lactobacillales bacterium]|nr:mannose-1-phosphate guanylyltransferase [Lactobacillales bacterium]